MGSRSVDLQVAEDMTSIITRNTAFGGITGMGGPNSSPLIAIAGPRHTILHAAKSSGQMVFLGESADLGAEPLAVDNRTASIFHVLTAAGMTRVTTANAPVIVSSTAFDPGGGKWLALYNTTFLATPLAKGGVQVIHATTGAQISKLPGIVSDSRFAYGYASNNVLYVVDGKTASITVLKINSVTGALSYIGKVRAPNCRDIIKVVLDENAATVGNLFVVCRRRIVRFTVPLSAVTDNDSLLPTFAQDYGASSTDYTDLVVIGDDQYWIGQDDPASASPLDAYYGPMLGVWDASLDELFVAAPKSSIWTVNNVIPYYDATTIDETVVPPVVIPPTITPSPPVITSSLTASVTEDTLFSYTITATGAGPITYGVTSPPSWLTSINPLTGAISGIPADPATVNITVTATNAGGTDTETLVVTVTNAIANLSAISINIAPTHMDVFGSLVYIVGSFTSVTDSSGTYARSQTACLNVSTGLWTSWNPGMTGNAFSKIKVSADGTYVYFAGASTISGGAVTRLRRVTTTGSGTLDATWIPTNPNDDIYGLDISGTSIYIAGGFSTPHLRMAAYSTVDASTLAFDATTDLTAGGGGAGVYGLHVGDGLLWASPAALGTSTTKAQGYAAFDLTTGTGVQMAQGVSVPSAFVEAKEIASIGSSYLAVRRSDGTGRSLVNLPGNTPVGTRTGNFRWDASGNSLADTNMSTADNWSSVVAHADVGYFFAAGGTSVVKVSTSGVVDASFTPTLNATPNYVRPVLTGVVIIGDFTLVNGSTRTRIAVLNATTGVLY